MRKLSIGLLLSAFALQAVDASPGSLHSIIVGDTSDSSIGLGIQSNLSNVNDLLQKVKASGVTLKTTIVIRDRSFSCQAIQKAIDSLVVEKDDSVLFYYSGHGFRRNSTQGTFPEFDCRREWADISIDFNQVNRQLRWDDSMRSSMGTRKRPKFLLAIADTCNTPIESASTRGIIERLSQQEVSALKHLFQDYTGRVSFSGSVPGEYSWYRNHADPDVGGGLFTGRLLTAITKASRHDTIRPRWEEIIVSSLETIRVENTTMGPQLQHPQMQTADLLESFSQ